MDKKWLTAETLRDVQKIVYQDRKLFFFNKNGGEELFIYDPSSESEIHLPCNSGGLAKEIIYFISALFGSDNEEFVVSEEGGIGLIAERKLIEWEESEE